MKLQVALDVTTIEKAITVLRAVHEYVDIAEVGTVGLYCGIPAISEIKKAFPKLEVLADFKIYDGAAEIAEAAFKAGADYVTVMGVADDFTIRETVRVAHQMKKYAVADMITCRNIVERMKEVDQLGVDFINVHIACDVQSVDNMPFEQLSIAKIVIKNAKIAVIGGINSGNIQKAVVYKPDIIVSGAGIYAQPDMRLTAKTMKEIMLEAE
jgi:3-hexulose-6-phosphate synthase